MPRLLRFERLQRRGLLASALIVACLSVSACGIGRDDSSGGSVPRQATRTPVAAPTALSGAPRIGSVVWASSIEPGSNAPLAGVPQQTDTTIFAVFPIESLPAGSQLVAAWYFNDTSLDALNSAMRIDQDRVSGWVEFHIERTGPDPWPDGEYTIVVSDGTNELQRGAITLTNL